MFKIFEFLLQLCFLIALSSAATTSTATTSAANISELVCNKGSGWYSGSDLKTAFLCEQTIYDDPRIYYCRNKELFDLETKKCKPASQVICKPSTSTCANGTGYYTRSGTGCRYFYYCKRTVTSFVCPSGTSFNKNQANLFGGNIFLPQFYCVKAK